MATIKTVLQMASTAAQLASKLQKTPAQANPATQQGGLPVASGSGSAPATGVDGPSVRPSQSTSRFEEAPTDGPSESAGEQAPRLALVAANDKAMARVEAQLALEEPTLDGLRAQLRELEVGGAAASAEPARASVTAASTGSAWAEGDWTPDELNRLFKDRPWIHQQNQTRGGQQASFQDVAEALAQGWSKDEIAHWVNKTHDSRIRSSGFPPGAPAMSPFGYEFAHSKFPGDPDAAWQYVTESWLHDRIHKDPSSAGLTLEQAFAKLWTTPGADLTSESVARNGAYMLSRAHSEFMSYARGQKATGNEFVSQTPPSTATATATGAPARPAMSDPTARPLTLPPAAVWTEGDWTDQELSRLFRDRPWIHQQNHSRGGQRASFDDVRAALAQGWSKDEIAHWVNKTHDSRIHSPGFPPGAPAMSPFGYEYAHSKFPADPDAAWQLVTESWLQARIEKDPASAGLTLVQAFAKLWTTPGSDWTSDAATRNGDYMLSRARSEFMNYAGGKKATGNEFVGSTAR
jgi:hypothetical protein